MPVKIYKRGQIWHYRGTVAKRRIQGSTRTSDKATAQRIAAEAERREWRCHLDGPESVVTMGQAVVAYLDAEKPHRFIARVAAYWKDTALKDVTPEAIRQSARIMYPRAKGATRNRQVIVPTQAIVNHAAALGWCRSISVPRFPVETTAKRPVTREWMAAFTAHASPHLAALALFMFGTGARISEALAVTWADVDLPGRRATIRQTKISDTRVAHLPPPVVAALANLEKQPGPVFGYAGRGSVKDPWAVACRRAGIEHLTPHCCRHGFATSLLRQGVDVKTVAKLGGWKDAATVLRTYAHALDDPTMTDAIFAEILTQQNEKTKENNALGGI
jgi:integrase